MELALCLPRPVLDFKPRLRGTQDSRLHTHRLLEATQRPGNPGARARAGEKGAGKDRATESLARACDVRRGSQRAMWAAGKERGRVFAWGRVWGRASRVSGPIEREEGVSRAC